MSNQDEVVIQIGNSLENGPVGVFARVEDALKALDEDSRWFHGDDKFLLKPHDRVEVVKVIITQRNKGTWAFLGTTRNKDRLLLREFLRERKWLDHPPRIDWDGSMLPRYPYTSTLDSRDSTRVRIADIDGSADETFWNFADALHSLENHDIWNRYPEISNSLSVTIVSRERLFNGTFVTISEAMEFIETVQSEVSYE